MSLREVIDTRVLGALRLVDGPTGAVIQRVMTVDSPTGNFIRNRSHHYVIRSAQGLEHHTTSFENAPGTPAVGDIDLPIRVHDPMHRYLPRASNIALPRDPDPSNADEPDSLFRAVPVAMYPSATFRLHPNWSAIRAALAVEGSPDTVLPGALLRVIRDSDDEVLARGLSDTRGEALVIVPGIPITNFAGSGEEEEEFDASGPVVIAETAVRLEVIVDHELPWPVDPEQLEANRATLLRPSNAPTDLTLRTGQVETLDLAVDMT